jgi:hypothetical protein
MAPGTFVFENKDTYEGNIEDGKMQGEGKITFKEGGSYVGSFFNDQYSGFGILTWKSGYRFEGMFKKDKLHGDGCLTNGEGVFYFGTWENDRYKETTITDGILTSPFTQSRIYRDLNSKLVSKSLPPVVFTIDDAKLYYGSLAIGKLYQEADLELPTWWEESLSEMSVGKKLVQGDIPDPTVSPSE